VNGAVDAGLAFSAATCERASLRALSRRAVPVLAGHVTVPLLQP